MKVSFKAARVNANITQSDAAKALGVAQSTLARWEADGNIPIQTVVAMCKMYGCSIDDFNLEPTANFKEGDGTKSE